MQRPVALPITHTHGLWFSLVADYLVRGTVVPIAFESPFDRPLPPVAGAFGWDTRKALELAEGVAEVHFVPPGSWSVTACRSTRIPWWQPGG